MVNQILSVDNTKKTKSRGNIDIRKIVMFFSIIMIIFSVGFIGIGTYAIVENNNLSYGWKKAQIELEKLEDKISIMVTSDTPIDRITYSWSDTNEEKEIKANSQNYIEELIDEPEQDGNYTISLKVYDVNGRITKYDKEYAIETQAPQLSIEPTNGKLKVIAKDNEKMSYITYRWDDGEEVKIDATEESAAQIEKTIEIPRGKHTLTVVAVNTKNKTKQKEQEVKGVTKPIISVVQDAEEPKYLILSVSDEEAIKNILFELNGQQYQIDLSEYQEKSIQYRIEQQPGENNVKVTATNFDGADATFEGSCTYGE